MISDGKKYTISLHQVAFSDVGVLILLVTSEKTQNRCD